MHSHPPDASSDLGLAFLVNAAFAVLEIVGGLWTNSVAILSDAVHDLGDSVALAAAWFLERRAGKGRDQRFSYGYRRFSLLGAWTSAGVLIIGTAFVLSEAIPRLLEPQPPHAPGMVGFAVLGIVANGLAAWRLHGREGLNARVAAWHLLEDVLGWAAVLVVGTTLLFVDLPVLDPALSIAISVFVLFNVARAFRQSLWLFLQAVPDEIDLDELESRLGALAHVCSTHHTHVWSLDGTRHVLTTHLVVDREATREEVEEVRQHVAGLCETYGFAHTTVEIEWGQGGCRMSPSLT